MDMEAGRALSVCIAGATGWTGRALVQGVLEAQDLELGGAVSRSAAGRDLGEALGREPLGVVVRASVGEALAGVDVLVDFTSATAVKANALAAIGAGVAVVVGTSGLGEVRPPELGHPLEDLHGPREARGATVAGTQVHSVRVPSFVVSTEVVFGLPGERLTIRHDAGPTPEPYVAGTLLAARRVRRRTGLTRGLDTLLLEAS